MPNETLKHLNNNHLNKKKMGKFVITMRKNSKTEARFEKKVASNGKPFFNLKATNGQVIGSSQRYASERTMKQGIASVMRNAPESPVVEEIE